MSSSSFGVLHLFFAYIFVLSTSSGLLGLLFSRRFHFSSYKIIVFSFAVVYEFLFPIVSLVLLNILLVKAFGLYSVRIARPWRVLLAFRIFIYIITGYRPMGL